MIVIDRNQWFVRIGQNPFISAFRRRFEQGVDFFNTSVALRREGKVNNADVRCWYADGGTIELENRAEGGLSATLRLSGGLSAEP